MVCLLLVLLHIATTMLIQERNAIAARSMATSSGVLNTSLLNGMNMIDTIKSTGSERSFYNMWYDSQRLYLRHHVSLPECIKQHDQLHW